jgi:hypothetical protein
MINVEELIRTINSTLPWSVGYNSALLLSIPIVAPLHWFVLSLFTLSLSLSFFSDLLYFLLFCYVIFSFSLTWCTYFHILSLVICCVRVYVYVYIYVFSLYICIYMNI